MARTRQEQQGVLASDCMLEARVVGRQTIAYWRKRHANRPWERWHACRLRHGGTVFDQLGPLGFGIVVRPNGP